MDSFESAPRARAHVVRADRGRTVDVTSDYTLRIAFRNCLKVAGDGDDLLRKTERGQMMLAWSGQSVVHQPPWAPFDFAQGKLRYTKEEDRR
jgi:hypothetical protein